MPSAQRVMILPQGCSAGNTVLLREPKTGQPHCCMATAQGELLELNHFKLMYTSWLVNNQLLSDGGVFLATPMDPLFIIIPMLDDARAQGGGHVYCAADQLLDHQDKSKVSPKDAQAVLTAAQAHLACVCDIKDVDGDNYYRLNDDKVLAWLLCKHDQCKTALSVQVQGLDDRGQDAYVASFIAEYLTSTWAQRLANHLGVELTSGAGLKHSQPGIGGEGPDKRPKLSQDEADRKPSTAALAPQDPTKAKQELAKQKAAQTRAINLAKQAAGTKKISAFFAPKPTQG